LDLVGHAWAGFGSAFGPLVLLSLLWRGTTRNGAIAGMLVGGLTVLLWTYLEHPYQEMYSMIPGFILSFLSIIVVSKLTSAPSEEVLTEFEAVRKELKETY
jgi:SSS family solute:Na+ symporter